MTSPEESLPSGSEPPPDAASSTAPRDSVQAEAVAETRRELRFAFEIGPGPERFVLPLGLQSELWPEPRITPLPGTAPWLRGLVNLRGTLAPVYEVAGSLGLQAPARARERLLVLGEGEQRVGLVVQGDPRPVTVVLHATPTPLALREPLARVVGDRWLTDSGDAYWELDLEAWIHHARESATLSSANLSASSSAEIERGFV